MRRALIWTETVLMIVLYASAIWAADRYFDYRRISRATALALAFSAVQFAGIIATLVVLFARKAIATRRARRSAELASELQQALALEAAGQDQRRILRSLYRRAPDDVVQAIENVLGTVRGDAAARITAVAKSLGVETVDVESRLERLFAAATDGTLLQRAVLTEELEPYAGRLAGEQIARTITSSDPHRIVAALEMVRAWKRVVPVRNVEQLLHHGSAAVRAAALRALPWTESIDAERTVRIGLRDRDARVRVAAAESAARMHFDGAVPFLEDNLIVDDHDTAVAAAFALAALPRGFDVLERMLTSDNRVAASVAFEALEKASLQRVELA